MITQRKRTGVGEWADASINCMWGCPNNCRYCYARAMAARVKRIDPANWKEETPRKFPRIPRKGSGRVMFPSSHDITPGNIDYSVEMIRQLIEANRNVLIVSKPRPECIAVICDEFIDHKDRILFRFTIGSTDDSVLRFWEPNAPCFDERIESLMIAYERGFPTSVSCEPMLDGCVESVIECVYPFATESIWIGRMNNAGSVLSLNGEYSDEVKMALEELRSLQSNLRLFNLSGDYGHDWKIRWKDNLWALFNTIANTLVTVREYNEMTPKERSSYRRRAGKLMQTDGIPFIGPKKKTSSKEGHSDRPNHLYLV